MPRLLPTALLLMCLVPALALGGDPPSLAQQLRDLDDARFAVRDRATRALVARGAPALAPLKALIAAPPSAEVAVRARQIVARIELRLWRATFKGGPVLDGLQLTLRNRKTRIVAGQPIDVEFEVRNTTDGARPYVPLRGVDVKMPWGGGRYTASHGTWTLEQIRGEQGVDGGFELGCGTAPDRTQVQLAAGARQITARNLRETLYVPGRAGLAVGRYRLTLTYYARSKRLLPGATADLVSNAVVFEIVAPPAPAPKTK